MTDDFSRCTWECTVKEAHTLVWGNCGSAVPPEEIDPRIPRMEGECWQLVVTASVTPKLLAFLDSYGLEVFPMPTSEDDLPTYGIGFRRAGEKT